MLRAGTTSRATHLTCAVAVHTGTRTATLATAVRTGALTSTLAASTPTVGIFRRRAV